MKIAIFSDSYAQLDGVSTHVRNISRGLTKRGHDVTVYTGSGASDDFKVVNLPRAAFPFSVGYDFVIPKRIKVDADVVHVHTVYPTGWMGITQKKPRVITTHTLPQNIFPGRLAFLRPFGWKYLIYFYNRADHGVCQTNRTEQIFRSHGLKIPISIASAGVDVDYLKAGDAKRFREQYKIDYDFVLFTARFSPEKRPEFALRACRELGLKIILTSKGPLQEKLRAKYPEAAFLKIKRRDIRDVYSAAKVFVMPSAPEVECEGLGPLEAMSCGVPVVCSDVPHLVEDGKNGFHVGTYGYEEFKQKLKLLWEDEALQKKFIQMGRETAEQRDIKQVVEKLIRVYEGLL